MKHTIFITGTNRGIGLEFVKQFAEEGHKVFATCRDPKNAIALKDLSQKYSNVIILKLDVQSKKQIEKLSQQMKDIPIDIVIHNAGISGRKDLTLDNATINDLDKEIREVMAVNTIAPLLLTKTLLPNLQIGKMKTVVAISSLISSITQNFAGEWNLYAYKASKAALNMMMSCFSVEPHYADFKVLIFDPGWVKTDMGGKEAPISPVDSVLGMRKIILNNSKIKSGSFLNYQGEIVPF